VKRRKFNHFVPANSGEVCHNSSIHGTYSMELVTAEVLDMDEDA
jgi:hypothetical protein